MTIVHRHPPVRRHQPGARPPRGGLPRVVHWGADLARHGRPASSPADVTGPVAAQPRRAVAPHRAAPRRRRLARHPGVAAHRAGGPAAPRWVVTTVGRRAFARRRATVDDPARVAPARRDRPRPARVAARWPSSSRSTRPVCCGQRHAAQRRGGTVRARRAARRAAGAGGRHRGARPDRPVVPGAVAAAHRCCRTAPTCGPRAAAAPGTTRRCCSWSARAGFGFRHGEVWAVHTAWSGDHEHLVERLPEGAGALRRPRRRRAARPRRGAARRRGRPTRRPRALRALRPTGSTGSRDACTAACARPRGHTTHPPPAGAQHLGGRLLRPRPRPAARPSPTGRRDRRRAVRARRRLVPRPPRRPQPASATGWSSTDVWPDGLAAARRPRQGPRACSSGSGSSRRWSTSTPTSSARTPTGCSAPRGRLAAALAPPARARPRPPRRVRARLTGQISALVGEHAASTTSSGTTTGTCTRPCGRTRPGTDRPAVHAQTAGGLPAARRAARAPPATSRSRPAPAVAARVDLGVLARTDRVWASDCNDALERAADPALDRRCWCPPS